MADATTTTAAGITEDQINELLEKKLGATVNNMLTARLATFEKKFGGTIAETLKAQLPELLKGLKPAEEPEPEKKSGGKKDDPELATLRKQMEALTQRAEEASRREAAMRERTRQQAIREQTRALLAKAGIDGDRFDAAYALLSHTGKILQAEDPESDDAFFADPGGPVALETGLSGWLKTEQAKIFLPPAGTRGSGSRAGSLNSNGAKLTPEQARMNVAAALIDELSR